MAQLDVVAKPLDRMLNNHKSFTWGSAEYMQYAHDFDFLSVFWLGINHFTHIILDFSSDTVAIIRLPVSMKQIWMIWVNESPP